TGISNTPCLISVRPAGKFSMWELGIERLRSETRVSCRLWTPCSRLGQQTDVQRDRELFRPERLHRVDRRRARRHQRRHSCSAERPGFVLPIPQAARKQRIRFAFHPSGSRTLATQPFAPTRFSSAMLPPWFSTISRDSTRPIPVPCGFVVKNGTQRLSVRAIPG